jgi:hypothetical protein
MVRVAAPALFDPREIAELRVLDGETVLGSTRDPDPRIEPAVAIKLTSRPEPGLRLAVMLRPEFAAGTIALFGDQAHKPVTVGANSPAAPLNPDHGLLGKMRSLFRR